MVLRPFVAISPVADRNLQEYGADDRCGVGVSSTRDHAMTIAMCDRELSSGEGLARDTARAMHVRSRPSTPSATCDTADRKQATKQRPVMQLCIWTYSRHARAACGVIASGCEQIASNTVKN